MALLTVRVDDDLHRKVKIATVASATTMAEIVREALTEYVAKNASSKKPAARKKSTAKRGKAKK